MNEWQVLRQAKHLLQAVTWPGGATAVFQPGSVAVTVGPDEKALATMSVPVVLLRPDRDVEPGSAIG